MEGQEGVGSPRLSWVKRWIAVTQRPSHNRPRRPLSWSPPLPALPSCALSQTYFIRHTRVFGLQLRLVGFFLIFPSGGAMSHPEFVREDNDADNGSDDGPDLQHLHSSISDAGTGSASAPTSKPQPNEGPTSMFPLPTTTTSVYILPLSTNIPILIFPPSINASTSPRYIPTYHALPDGSLLTPLYTENLIESNARLFGGSALLTLFIINVWIAATFLRRAQLSSIKDKSLFYLLLASQVMGPVAFASLLVPFFSGSANCTVYVLHSSRLTLVY